MMNAIVDRIERIEIPHYKRGVKTYFRKSELTDWQLDTRIPSNAELSAVGTTYAVLNKK